MYDECKLNKLRYYLMLMISKFTYLSNKLMYLTNSLRQFKTVLELMMTLVLNDKNKPLEQL